jgi:hypothetical protein
MAVGRAGADVGATSTPVQLSTSTGAAADTTSTTPKGATMAKKPPKHILQAHRLICGRDKLLRKSHSKAEYRHLAEVRSLFEDRNIAGLGIAEKVSDKKRSGEHSLCFYVREKKAKRGLRSNRMIPPVISVGGRPVFTDVYQIGHLKAQGNAQVSPIQSGFSLSNSQSEGAGTLGAIVKSGAARYILSNTHVLVPQQIKNPPIQAIYPAWPADTDSDEPRPVGVLRDFVKLTDSGNTADAALAEIDPQFLNDINTTIFKAAVPHDVGDPEIGMVIVGNGRTSGPMEGIVKDCHCHPFKVDFSETGFGMIGFVDQVMCSHYSQDGDSGSLIVAKDSGKIVGLHVGGSDEGSFFTPIKAVQVALNIKFSFL